MTECLVRCLLGFGLGLALAGPSAAADALTEQSLLGMLAGKQELRAEFSETRRSMLLKSPLTLSGTLLFRAPDYLEKNIVHPSPERQIVDGDRLRVEKPGREPLNMSLATVPELEMVMVSMRATLAGDLRALQRFYQLRLSGDLGAWTLRLLPRAPELAEILRYIDISGSHDAVAGFHVVQNGGNESTLVINPQ